MKNYFKIAFGIALVSALSVGCKKDSAKPEQTAPFTVTSNTFKDGTVDHEFLTQNNVTKSDIEWKNAPANAKGFYIVMNNNEGHNYLTTTVTKNGDSLNWGNRDFNLPRGYKEGKTAEIEIFALSCTPDELKDIVTKKMKKEDLEDNDLRRKFRTMLQKYNLSHIILGSTVAKYTIKNMPAANPSVGPIR